MPSTCAVAHDTRVGRGGSFTARRTSLLIARLTVKPMAWLAFTKAEDVEYTHTSPVEL